MSMNRHTVRSRSRRNTVWVIEQGRKLISANQSLWKWNQPVDNFGPIFEKGKSRQMGFGGGQFRGQDVDHSGGRPSTWESSLETGAREVQATRHCSERLHACAKIA